MRHHRTAAPHSRLARALVLGAAAAAASVAGPVAPAAAEGGRPEQGVVHVIPAECRHHMALPAGPRDEQIEWEHGLSFAACLQDVPLRRIDDPLQLEPLVEALTARLELPMLLYLQAMAEGPREIQLRAAFHVGLANIALVTRARAAVAAPPDLAADPAAAARWRELGAQLEPLLAHAQRTAWLSFTALHEAALHDPALAGSEVDRNMIRTARELRVYLRGAAEVPAR